MSTRSLRLTSRHYLPQHILVLSAKSKLNKFNRCTRKFELTLNDRTKGIRSGLILVARESYLERETRFGFNFGRTVFQSEDLSPYVTDTNSEEEGIEDAEQDSRVNLFLAGENGARDYSNP
ncbi:hypothetical protein Tco_0074290 [Tanacetum coccineum]